jgi:FKBP-type peptidyl-prolyl cis-trans isomerase
MSTDLVIGNGREVAAGNTVDGQYSGWVHENGTRGKLFDTSIGGRSFTVTIGLADIKGWTEGLTGMRVGGSGS